METKDISVEALAAFVGSLPLVGGVGDSTLKNLKPVPKMLKYVDPFIINFEEIDAEATVEKFIEDTNAQVGPSSRSSYKSRINQAIKLYKNFLADPNSIFENQESEVKVKKQLPQTLVLPPQLPSESKQSTIDIPVPIRDGIILTIPGVPTDLTNEEAERIASILKVYARPRHEFE